MAEKVDH
jgi:hypothetical protein